MNYATFYGCTSLTSVTIPASVTGTIGGDCFEGCTNLETVTIEGGQSPLSIGTVGGWSSGFLKNAKVTTLDLPARVNELGGLMLNCPVQTLILRSETPPGNNYTRRGQYMTIYVPDTAL